MDKFIFLDSQGWTKYYSGSINSNIDPIGVDSTRRLGIRRFDYRYTRVY